MSLYKKYRQEEPLVTERYPELSDQLSNLVELQDDHFDMVKKLLAPRGSSGTSPLFNLDILTLSILNRSLDLIQGFCEAYPTWNLTVAAPVVRMQLDNVMRLVIIIDAPASAGLVDAMLDGERLSKVTDPLGPPGKRYKLTDSRLQEHAERHFPWLRLVYDKTSKWVHFSPTFVGSTFRVDDDIIAARFPFSTDKIPLELLESVLWAMYQASAAVLYCADEIAKAKHLAAEQEFPSSR